MCRCRVRTVRARNRWRCHSSMPPGGGNHLRLDELVDRALLQDLQCAEGPFALDLPELDIESTVLNRLAVLEVLCKSQAQTIDALQRENNRLHSCLTASTSHDPTSPDTHQRDSIEYAAHYASAASAFVPFKGRSHTVEGNANASARRPAAAFIPAVHQQRSASSRHQAAVHSLTSTSALRPLQREDFLAKLPKVVIKGGQVLPIRSCIEAFLRGDETALQTAVVQSAPEIQKALAEIAVVLKQHAPSNALDASHDNHRRSQIRPGGSQSCSPSMLASPEHGTFLRNDDGLSAKGYVEHVWLGPDPITSPSEVLLQPPRAADVHRSAHDSARITTSHTTSSTSQDAAMSPMHQCSSPEDTPGCDQLVQYVLRELLG